MFDLKQYRKPGKIEAVILIFVVLLILGYPMIMIPNMVPHIPVLLAIIFLLIYGMIFKIKFSYMQQSMIESVSTSMGAVLLFFFIGMLVSILILSGAIPTLIYYGLDIMSSRAFYLSSFLISAIVGISIGSSLTTVATLGVALMGISNVFGLNPAISAGAIVSGAFFGDKMSPLSDTTTISASIVGVDLFEHIKNMMYTTVPAFAISTIFFYLLSPNDKIGDISIILKFKTDILNSGLINPFSIITFILLIILSILKVPAIPTIIYTSILGTLVSFFNSSYSFGEISKFLFYGYSKDGLSENITSLLSRGGVSSMFFTMSIVILALSLGGLLFGLGIIPSLLDSISHLLTTPLRATFCVVITSLGINYIVGEQYLSILLSGKTFKPIYDRLGLHPKNLSRTLEDSGTVINPLVPWGVCGVFITSVLGVNTIEYMPYAIFCYSSLVLTLLFGFTGITLSKK